MRAKHRPAASCMSSTGNPACNLGVCPARGHTGNLSVHGRVPAQWSTLARAGLFLAGWSVRFRLDLLYSPAPWSPSPSALWSWVVRPLPPSTASECGGGWVPSRGSCGRAGGGDPGFPFPAGSPLCSTLGCPAARSLAPAHIPAVMLWVSGLELLSVRGTGFSQHGGFFGDGDWRGGSWKGPTGLCTGRLLPGAAGSVTRVFGQITSPLRVRLRVVVPHPALSFPSWASVSTSVRGESHTQCSPRPYGLAFRGGRRWDAGGGNTNGRPARSLVHYRT